MALPAGRYGITKSMLRLIKKIPSMFGKVEGDKASWYIFPGTHFIKDGVVKVATQNILPNDPITESNTDDTTLFEVIEKKANGIETRVTNVTTLIFDYPREDATIHAAALLLLSGGLYHLLIQSDNDVIVTKIVDNNASRSASATYSSGVLTITFTEPVYGGVTLIANNLLN